MLGPLLYILFTHNCVAKQDSNTIIKFADNTTVVGLITKRDETAYREDFRDMAVWCQDNNLSLNDEQDIGADRGLQEKETRTGPQ